MGDTCACPPPHVPPTHFYTTASSARDLICRGFVGGQMLSVSCSTNLTSSATIAHALSTGSLFEGRREHDLTFSTSNNQTYLNAWCPGMSTSIKEGAINVVVTEGATQPPPCCVVHSSTRASTPTSLVRSTHRRM